MSLSAFDTSLPFVLRWEGGYVNHPDDPGGATNKGVTQKVYDRWRRRGGLPPRPVQLVDDSEVHAIYEIDYWLPSRCDVLRRKLDLVQFDTSVNMGTGRAIRHLQTALECGVDGEFGPITLSAAGACDLGTATTAYCAAREAYYRLLVQKNPRLQRFLKGWLNRLNALRREAGLPGYAATQALDYGDMPYVARIPDIGEDPAYDVWPPL